MTSAVTTEGLVKRFGETVALAGVDLEVEQGSVLGLLGPNGAGKTTVVRVLATLLKPDEGRAEVFGRDVVEDPDGVRGMIGLTGQFAAIDEILTGRENLQMFGRLFRLGRADAARRASDLLVRLDLDDAADRQAKTYSGGMRRRLDLASSLLTRPRVLFLDEPTTGLDPRSRNQIWEVVRELVSEGTTLFLTTQYLAEADRLADRIAVIDHGRVIAQGTATSSRTGWAARCSRCACRRRRPRAGQRALAALGCGEPQRRGNRRGGGARAARRVGMVAEAARALQAAGVAVSDLGLRRPTLDDVFLELTGAAPDEDGTESDEEEGRSRRSRPRRRR